MNTTGQLREPEDIQVQKFRCALKECAMNETIPITKIYEEELNKTRYSSEMMARLPLIHEIRKDIICFNL